MSTLLVQSSASRTVRRLSYEVKYTSRSIIGAVRYTNLSSSVLGDIEFIRMDKNRQIITVFLNIAARTIYNGTHIQCSILGMDELLTSQPVSMILQGMYCVRL